MSDNSYVHVKFPRTTIDITALCDTGANCCCITSSVFYLLPDSCKSPLNSVNHTEAKTAGGFQLTILRQSSLEFTLGQTIYTQKMYVTDDLIVDMIIGRDFLVKNGATIDMQRNALKLKRSYMVRAPEKVHIQGNVQQHIYGVIEGIPNAMSGLVRAHTTVSNKGLLLANSLSKTKDGKVLVRVLNGNEKG